MFNNYLKTAIRNITRNKVYSFLNTIKLALGIAIFVITMLFVNSEYKFDMYNESVNDIYRLEYDKDRNCHITSAMGIGLYASFPVD